MQLGDCSVMAFHFSSSKHFGLLTCLGLCLYAVVVVFVVVLLLFLVPGLYASLFIPYSGKFLRGPIFTVFAVYWQTTKIKSAK